MKISSKLIEATHQRRLNRFSCVVSLRGREERAYLPNSGRLADLLVSGRSVFLRGAERAGRSTRYDMIMASAGEQLVCLDSRVANKVFCEAIEEGRLDEFGGYSLDF